MNEESYWEKNPEPSKGHFRFHPAPASIFLVSSMQFSPKHMVTGLQMGAGAAPAGLLPSASMGAGTALFVTTFEHKRYSLV